MGCNCKNAKKVEALLPNANDKTYKKHSLKSIGLWIWDIIVSLVGKLCVMLLVCMLCPIIIAILLFNLFFRGGMFLEIPDFLLKKVKHYEKKMNELNQIVDDGAELSN